MTEQTVQDFHVHIYFDPSDLGRARALAEEAKDRFQIRVGHFHEGAVGPHPRGSVQLTVPTELFGAVAGWLAVNRAGLTVFAHASTGDDKRDHTHNVVWFGPSEQLDLAIFG